MAMHVTFRPMHGLHKVCTSSQTLCRLRESLVRLKTRTFLTAPVNWKENEGGSQDSSPTTTRVDLRRALLSRSRRHLSPLDRISSMLPEDVLSPEVMQLREQPGREGDSQGSGGVREGGAEHPGGHPELDAEPSTLPGQSLLAFGDLLVAEHRKKRLEFRKMFELQAGRRLQSSWGVVLHDEVAGQPAGRYFKTNLGVSLFIRRASLDDYVLHMKRGPAIAYPKDAATMLMMMDVTEGDCVLESGSGSGAMSLFLSRAGLFKKLKLEDRSYNGKVGSKGSVLSVEIREDHHKRAARNFQRWRTSWSLRGGREWPDNVQFHNADLSAASALLAGRGFNSVALDLINPQLVLPTILPHLHPGAVCAVYLANVTQVVDLLEGVRCSTLPLLCERIVEVPVREWVVAPALQKDGRYHIREPPILDKELPREDETSHDSDREDLTAEGEADPAAFGSIPYIARPHPEQMSHTAFLVKLRKFVQ